MTAARRAMPESHARQLLGVGPLATPQEVQSAFRKLARVLHPDKSDSADATAKFQLILAAKNLLCPADGRPEEDPRDRQEREARERARREREAREEREREAREAREREELAREYARLEREAQEARAQEAKRGVLKDLFFLRAKVWGVWRCAECGKERVTLRPEKHVCACGRRLKEHLPSKGFTAPDCPGFRLKAPGRAVPGVEADCACPDCGAAWNDHCADFAAPGEGAQDETPRRDSTPRTARAAEPASASREKPRPGANPVPGVQSDRERREKRIRHLHSINARLQQEDPDVGKRVTGLDDLDAELRAADALLRQHTVFAAGAHSTGERKPSKRQESPRRERPSPMSARGWGAARARSPPSNRQPFSAR